MPLVGLGREISIFEGQKLIQVLSLNHGRELLGFGTITPNKLWSLSLFFD